MNTQQGSLDDCLARVTQAEKSLFSALNEIVDTRKSILQLVAQSEHGIVPKTPPPEKSILISVEKEHSDSSNHVADVKLSDNIIDQYLGVHQASAKERAPPKFEDGFSKHVCEDCLPEEAGERSSLASLPPQRIRSNRSGSFRNLSMEAERSLQVNIAEIAEVTGQQLGLSSEDVVNAYNLFCEHDDDQSGKLSVAELQDILSEITGKKLGKKETDNILRECDKNFDSELDFEEFLLCICNTRERKAAHLDAAVYQDNKMNRKFLLQLKGIPYTTLTGFLQKEINEMTAFLSIPIIALLFFCFVLSSHLHREVSVLHSFESSLKVDIEDNANFAYSGMTPFENGREGFKNIYDMHTLEDFWSFLDLGLMPLFFPSGWSVSESRSNVAAYCTSPFDSMKSGGWDTTDFKGDPKNYSATRGYFLDSNMCDLERPPSEFPEALKSLDQFANSTRKPYRLFNEIIAGVRMSQEQLPTVDCERPGWFGRIYVTPCIEENAWAWLRPEMDTALQMNDELVDRPGGETVYLKSATSLTDVKTKLRQLENNRWLNQKTSKVQILLTTYNNHMDIFSATYINIVLNRAGHMHKVVKPVCIWLHPYRYVVAYVTDIVLAILVLRMFVSEVYELGLSLKDKGLRNGLGEYFNSYKNIMDWLSIAYSAVIFVTWFIWCRKVSKFADLLKTADSHVVGSWPGTLDIFTPTNAQYWEDVDSLVNYYRTHLTYVVAYYPFVLGARFFAICSSQPRLGLVTATLTMAAKDIFHFLVVLFATLVIFCASGELLFGLEVDEYENFGRTFISVFRAMLGDFDYIALTEVGRFPAAVWWLLFVVLVNLIMLNMLLVIIMDVYGNIKSGLNSDDEENFPTIWSQTYEVLERWSNQYKGKEMSISKILDVLETKEETLLHNSRREIDGSESVTRQPKLITVSRFLEHVNGLGLKQAENLLEKAYEWDEVRTSQSNATSLEDLMDKLRTVDLRVQQTQEVLDNLHPQRHRRESVEPSPREGPRAAVREPAAGAAIREPSTRVASGPPQAEPTWC